MSVPLCKDCKHFKKGWFTEIRYAKCASPRNGTSCVDGTVIVRYADLNRQSYGCMEHGKFFEPKL